MHNIEIGKYTYGGANIQIVRPHKDTKLVIGKFCSIALNLKIYFNNNHHVEYISTYPFSNRHVEVFNKGKISGYSGPSRGDIIIGNDVWIGDNVTIMSGVRIGDGATIGANSHVMSRVKPYSVVGGNPAQLFYFKYSKEKIKKLLELKWWDMPDDEIAKIAHILSSNNIDKLLKMYEK